MDVNNQKTNDKIDGKVLPEVHNAYRILVSRCDNKRPFVMPVRHYNGDAGYDLSACQSFTVHPQAFAQVPTNVRAALPPHTWGLIVGRSSTFYRKNLIVSPGIIDNGWTDELLGVVYNPTKNKVRVQTGERLVQLIIFNLVSPGIEYADELPERERGSKGFGSTGGM